MNNEKRKNGLCTGPLNRIEFYLHITSISAQNTLWHALPIIQHRCIKCGTLDVGPDIRCTWWRHLMETFSALLDLYAGSSPVTFNTGIPTQRPVTRSFDVFYDLHLNKRLNKQSWGWWYETPSCSLWRHCNQLFIIRSLPISTRRNDHITITAETHRVDVIFVIVSWT